MVAAVQFGQKKKFNISQPKNEHKNSAQAKGAFCFNDIVYCDS